METFETTTLINAPVTIVWETLISSGKSDWNPMIKKMNGNLAKDETIEVGLKFGEKKEMTFKPKVLVYQKEEEFRWLGHLFVKGLFDGEHYFKVRSINPNQTELIHGEQFRGLLVKPILKMIGKETMEGFKAMNSALKEQAEKEGQ